MVEEFSVKYKAMVIQQRKPFNYNQCLNDGFKCSKAEWVCFANNDTEFLPGWDKIIEYGYDSVSPLNPSWFKQAGMSGVCEGYEVGKHICGWCIVVKSTVLKKIGGFPDDVECWMSDNLYADVLQYYGIKHALITDCKVRHTPSTTLLQSKNIAYLTDGQEKIYQEARKKWIGKAPEEKNGIEFCTIDNGCYNSYLGKSVLPNLTVYPSTDSPARVYNEHIKKSKAQYICFLHTDVTCQGFKEAIERTIELVPDFGALGAVGSWFGTRWSRQGQIWELKTCDSCCIVINRDHGLLFDEKNFPGFHLYVENYCMEIRNRGLRVYTIDTFAFEFKGEFLTSANFFCHHSFTWNKLGSSWGNYPKYRKILSDKWENVETT